MWQQVEGTQRLSKILCPPKQPLLGEQARRESASSLVIVMKCKNRGMVQTSFILHKSWAHHNKLRPTKPEYWGYNSSWLNYIHKDVPGTPSGRGNKKEGWVAITHWPDIKDSRENKARRDFPLRHGQKPGTLCRFHSSCTLFQHAKSTIQLHNNLVTYTSKNHSALMTSRHI